MAGFETAPSRLHTGWRAWFHLPAAAWSRLLILFFALGLTKLILIFGLRRHLQEVHWRVAGHPTNWVNEAAFYAFVLVGVLSLLGLGRQCQSQGRQVVRMANAMVVWLGLLFIFLTFHEGEYNYLYPIMTQVLGWKALGPYLSLNFFFRPPFLAVWFLAYGVAYYWVARKGREDRVLYLTAVFAGAYALLCLRDLINYRDELLVVSCLGLLALQNLRRPTGRPASVWAFVPVAWALVAWGIFNFGLQATKELNPYFVLIVGVSVVVFGGMTVLAWRRGFYGPWCNLLPFGVAALLLFAGAAHYPMARNYTNLLCHALVFPHYFLGELAVTAIIIGVTILYYRLRPDGSLWWLDILVLSLIVLALADLRLTQIMGVRLEWDVLSFGNSIKMMWRLAKPYLPGALAGLAVVVLVYWAGSQALRFWLRGKNNDAGSGGFSVGADYTGICFLALGVVGAAVIQPDKAGGQTVVRLVQTHPLWKRSSKPPLPPDEFMRSAQALGLGDFARPPRAATTLPPRDLNVVLVFMESSYNKHLALFGGEQETQPLLSKYKDRMEVFPNFFSNFAGSIHARWATFTSLYPVTDFNQFTKQRVPVKSLFDVLHEQGYTCSMFYSSFFDYTGFRDFLNQHQLDEKYDADTMPGPRHSQPAAWGLHEEETLAAMQAQIRKYAAGQQRFFLTYVPAAPHYPYDAIPTRFREHKAGELGDYTPFYLNELLYMDWVITSIVDQLKESGLLEKTLIIITDDHGEMLGGEEGAIGHGWAVTPELANVPLLLMDPEQPGYRINSTVGSQVDLLPTVLDVLRIPLPVDQLYQGRSLYASNKPAADRAYLNSYQQYGVITGDRIVVGDRKAEAGGSSISSHSAYGITNHGATTKFIPIENDGQSSVSIQHFDAFQENLLRNYSHYCETLRSGQPGNTHSAKR